MYDVLTNNGHTVDVEALDPHLVHQVRDDLRRQTVLLLLECFDVILCIADLILQRPHLSDVS